MPAKLLGEVLAKSAVFSWRLMIMLHVTLAGKPFHGSTRGRRQQETRGYQWYDRASSLVL